MEARSKFLIDDKVIELSQVVDVIESPLTDAIQDKDVWLMVMMEDGTFTTIRGRATTEAFRQAMDHHLGADLI